MTGLDGRSLPDRSLLDWEGCSVEPSAFDSREDRVTETHRTEEA